MGLTIDTTGFTKEENRLALEVMDLDLGAKVATERLRRLVIERDRLAHLVREARASQKSISGKAYRAEYRLERMIGYEEGHRDNKRYLAKSDAYCRRMDESERGRYAKRGS